MASLLAVGASLPGGLGTRGRRGGRPSRWLAWGGRSLMDAAADAAAGAGGGQRGQQAAGTRTSH